ncbi:uncharacterized protein LOC129599014 isoform X2 [Paramacrobiotus metropolitanus]|nr:uncharacterized protein LOC129599014 isoform X2 [Paramacrobiotus metropolitanus]
MDPASGSLKTCAAASNVCQIGTGLRAGSPDTSKLTLVMGRNCGRTDAQTIGKNTRLLAKKPANSQMICETLQRQDGPGTLQVDRRCVCSTDKCNDEIWDEVMVHPLMQSDWEATNADPVIPTLGSNSVSELEKATDAGPDMAVIIAAALGGLLVIGLVLLAVWWFVLRKRGGAEEDEEEDEENTSGASGSASASASASGRTWDEQEDQATGLKTYKTDLKAPAIP